MTDTLDKHLNDFLASMKWSNEATQHEKTLVNGNLNGFVSFLREKGYAKIYEAAIESAWKYDSPTLLVETIKEFAPHGGTRGKS